jgi:RNA polymerase sigma-B factor
LRNALVEEYLYMAQAVARRFSGRGAEVDDLIQVASVALLRALERYDADKGVAFTSFAVPTMVGEIRNYLRDKVKPLRFPRQSSELLLKIKKIRENFVQGHMREPSVMELSAALGVPQDAVLDALEVQQAAQSVSLDASVSKEESTTLSELLGAEETAYNDLEMVDYLNRLLSALEGNARYVLEQRFFHQRNQRDIARELGISQMQVSRLERRALQILRITYLQREGRELVEK